MIPRNLLFSIVGLVLAVLPAMGQDASGIASTIDRLVADLEARGLVADPDTASAAAMEAIARSLDPQSELVPENGDTPPPALLGLGLSLTLSNGVPVITEAPESHPAGQAGLTAGDHLLALDGEPLLRKPLHEVTARLRGTSTNPVTLRYRPASAPDTTQTVSLVREAVPVPSLETAERLPGDLGYVLLNDLGPDAGKDTVMRFRQWSETGAGGLILDLRGAGGDHADAAMSIAALFCPGGSLVCTVRDRDDQDLAVHRCDQTSPVAVPAILLVDRNTRGFAEALAAALQDASSGVLTLGEPTSGDFGLREVIDLPTGHRLRIATRKLVTATGRTYDGSAGFTPDIVVDPADAPVSDFDPEPVIGRRDVLTEEYEDRALRRRVLGDPVLQQAVDILLGLQALNLPRSS